MKYLLFLFSLLLASITVSAQTSEEFYKMAEQKIAADQFLDAHALIEKAIEKDKNNYNNYILKSLIDFKLKKYSEALKTSLIAIQVAPDKSEPYDLAGRLYNSYGFQDSAIVMFNRAINKAESDSIKYQGYLNRASAYTDKREFKSAIKDLEFLLHAMPDNPAALNNLAINYAYQKDHKKAIIFLEKLAKLDSTTAYPFINLGLYHTETGNYKAAMANFDYALSLSAETDPLLYSNRGYLFYKMGDYTAAIKDLNRSIDGYPSNSYVYRNRALVYMAMQKPGEACRDLEAALHYGFTQTYGDEVKKISEEELPLEKTYSVPINS